LVDSGVAPASGNGYRAQPPPWQCSVCENLRVSPTPLTEIHVPIWRSPSYRTTTS